MARASFRNVTNVFYFKKPANNRKWFLLLLPFPYDIRLNAANHYKNTPMQYTEIFLFVKMKICKNENFHLKNFDICNSFAQNIDHEYTLELPPTSTYNVCFAIKVGFTGGIHNMDRFS